MPPPERTAARFLLTTDPGLEPVAAEELLEALPGTQVSLQPFGKPGLLLVETGGRTSLPRLTTIHDVVEVYRVCEARSLDAIKAAAAEVEFPELAQAGSFRVTSVHGGEHEFSGVEIQRAAGAAVVGRHGTPVELKEFEVEVRADLYGAQLVLGIQRHREEFGRRIRRARSLRSALKPTIAAAMLRLAGAHRGAGTLHDPLCGIGTIPIEAATINPELTISASDWDPETVAAARETVANHALPIEVQEFDARSLGEPGRGPFDFIVTDPPYGVRQARRTSTSRLYGSLLPAFEAALRPGGTLALVVVKARVLRAALERTRLQVIDERTVRTGGLDLRIFVLRSEIPGG